MHFLHKITVLLLVATVATHAQTIDKITESGSSLQLQIDASRPLINSLTNEVYADLGTLGDESIKITCSKINCVLNGTLVASVNGVSAPKSAPCSSYAAGSANEFYCLLQTFNSTLKADCYTYYEVACSILESNSTNDTTKFLIQRLFNDNIPRTKLGQRLDQSGPPIIHFVDREPVSCEVVRSSCQQPLLFDKIEWFSPNNKSLNVPVNVTDITDSITKFSIPFPVTPDLQVGQPYKCCTTLNGQPVGRCQVMIPILTITTTTTTTTTTKTTTQQPTTATTTTTPAPTTPTSPPTTTRIKPPCTICSSGVKLDGKLLSVLFMNLCMLIATRF